MKKIIFLFLILSSQFIFSQSGWYPLTTGTNAGFYSSYFTDVNTGYLAADSGRIFKTTNGGTNWNMSTVNRLRDLRSVYFTDVSTGYICGDSGYIIKTTNAGLNWYQLTQNTYEWLWTIYFIDANTGFTGGTNGLILRTTNSGVNWLLINTAMPYSIQSFHFLNNNTGYFTGGTYDIQGFTYKTTNAGLNWINMFITAEPINSVYFIDINTGYAAGGDFEFGYIFEKTTNAGISWNNQMNPAIFGVCFSMKFIDANTGYSAGLGGIIKTTNGGLNWNTQYNGLNMPMTLFMLNSLTGYAAGQNGLILRTNTGGDVVYQSISGQVSYQDNNQTVTSGYVKALHYDSIASSVSTIDSAQIQPNGSYMMSHIPPHITLDIMAFENDEYQQSYVPTYYPSTTSWHNAVTLVADSNLTNINIGVYRVINPTGPMFISGHILKGTQNPLPGLSGAIVYVKTGNNYNAYSISNNSGLYNTRALNQGSYNVSVEFIGYSELSKEVTLTNFSKDTIDFILNNFLIGITQQNLSVPMSYWLGTNYPNPFNPSTRINFGIPKSALVKLVIYDMLGREAAVIVNEELKAGNYSAEWNAAQFASGIYFYRIEAADPSTSSGRSFTQTKKMVLIK